jgi:hypothetical protein
MMLDNISIKYFKKAVPVIKKDTPSEVSGNCPVCNDKKGRLHLYRPKGFEQDVVHCFNSGCELEEKHHSMLNFLKIAAPELVSSYQRETFKDKIADINNSEKILSIIDRIEKKVNKQPDVKIEVPLHKLFTKCQEVERCRKYVKSRGFEVKEDWYFSENNFYTYNQKKYYLKDFLIIPIYQENKYAGFYSRSIREKAFSTFLLPWAEKFWTDCPETTSENVEIITEGVFDALSTGFGKVGAMLSASLPPDFEFNKNVIIALDNDKTGIQKSLKYVDQYNVFIWPDGLDYKDFNEMLLDGYRPKRIKDIILDNTYRGIEAKVRLKMKEVL